MAGSSDEEVDSILQTMGFSNELIRKSKQKPRLKKIFQNLLPEVSAEESVEHKNQSPVQEEQSEIYFDEHSMSILENLVEENRLDEVLPTDFTSLKNVSPALLIPPSNLFLKGDQINSVENGRVEYKTFDCLESTDSPILAPNSLPPASDIVDIITTVVSAVAETSLQPENDDDTIERVQCQSDNLMHSAPAVEGESSSLDQTDVLDEPTSRPTTSDIVEDNRKSLVVVTTVVSAVAEPSLQPENDDNTIERVQLHSRPAVDGESSSLDQTGVLEYSKIEPRRGVKRSHEKNKRMTGKAYLGLKKRGDKWFQDIERSARELGPRCTSDYCLKGGHQCRNITERERKNLFDKFWSEMDWAAKKIFVVSMIDVHKPHRRAKETSDSRKTLSKKYHLNINNQRVQVCRIFFLNTLGLKEWTVRYWLSPNQSTDEAVEPTQELRQSHQDNGPSPPKRSRNNVSIKHQSVVRFLESMPKVPSHYCRKSTTKLYLEPIVHSLNNLYALYVDFYKDQDQDIVSVRTFRRIFERMNIGIFQPKKDICDTCSKYKVGNLSKEIYDEHVKEKDEAREMKNLDKDEAKEGKCYVFTVDLQSVKLAPFLRTSSMYYKTKLCVYNYTVYNLADNRVRCYWFTEVDTDLTASTFASCLVDILSQYIDENPLPIIIYSDGCTYQNRNAIIANALLHLSKKKGVRIEQKYLVKGHTQMECDSVHSCIERQLKNKEIYLPSQYAQIAKDARKNPFPYEQKILSFDFFKNYKLNMVYSSIKPSGAVVTDIRSILYQDGKTKYKLTHDKNAIYQDLPLRPRTVNYDFLFPNLHSQRLTIKKSKYQHLQELKEFIPRDCHEFYDSLPKAN